MADNGHEVVDISVDYRISGQFVTRLAHFTPNAALVRTTEHVPPVAH